MWNNNMYLYGGYSDKGASDEIWSLYAKEIPIKGLPVINIESMQKGK